MTINKNQILEMTKKILRHTEGLRDQSIMHPVREWFIGLGVGTAIFIFVAAGSGYTYWRNKEVNVTYDDAPTEITVYRDSQVKDALTLYRNRDRERESLLEEGKIRAPIFNATTTDSVASSTDTIMPTSVATSS